MPLSPKESNEIIEISSTELDNSDGEEESIDSCEFPFLRKIDAHLNGDLSSVAIESSDSSWVKTETEDDEDETADHTTVQSSCSPRIERASRHRKQQSSSEIQCRLPSKA